MNIIVNPVILLLLVVMVMSCGIKQDNEKIVKKSPVIKELATDRKRGKTKFEVKRSVMKQNFKSLKYDKIAAYDYLGFSGEHTFPIVDGEGYLIDSSLINKTITLTEEQAKHITKILGDKKTYSNRNIVNCYEPRLAFVYFQDNKVIGKVMICLGCKKIESTIPLPNGEHYIDFGDIGKKRFGEFCSELGFPSCNN